MSGKIKGTEYDLEFKSLFHHFEMCSKSISNFEIGKFIQKYQLEHCQTAHLRIKDGKSAYKGEETEQGLALRVMDITQKMIGAHDMLALNMNNVDEVQPAIVDIQNALNNFPNLPKNSECIEKINKWVTILK